MVKPWKTNEATGQSRVLNMAGNALQSCPHLAFQALESLEIIPPPVASLIGKLNLI